VREAVGAAATVSTLGTATNNGELSLTVGEETLTAGVEHVDDLRSAWASTID
jgi:phosphoribosylformylglycinamidine synthase